MKFQRHNEKYKPTFLFSNPIINGINFLLAVLFLASSYSHASELQPSQWGIPLTVQLGERPFYLVNEMKPSPLKQKLEECTEGTFYKSDFSIGHRGAALQFPEHTQQSYLAAARQGAGIVECDVTFTKDKELVCRHSQCDLATTTNILTIPELAKKCSVPFKPYDKETDTAATATCCTSDISLAEFKSLCGKMDASDPKALTAREFLGGTANFRTDLYSSCGAVLSHKESIEIFKGLGVKMTPELKSASVEMPFQGDFTQADYAQKMIDEYKQAGVPAEDVFAQSFNLDDVLHWIKNEPQFGHQAVYLDDRVYSDPSFKATAEDMNALIEQGVKIIAPPMWALVTLDENQKIVPSEYTALAQDAGLDIITWTLERSGPLNNGGGWYFQTITDATTNDGVTYEILEVLAKDIGVLGVFSDWPATVTYYANCNGIKLN